MKTKYWVLLLSGVLAVSLALCLWLYRPREGATRAEIWSGGELVQTVELRIDQSLVVEHGGGRNVVTVEQGRIAVTEADCPDGYCMRRGFCAGGVPIVCLPNRLTIRFVGGSSQVDAVAG